jgi:signal transduction histidine kinase
MKVWSWWYRLVNLGIYDELTDNEVKATGLINRISIFCIAVFAVIGLLINVVVSFSVYTTLLYLLNVLPFGLTLYFNSRHKLNLSKHFFCIYSLVYVTALCLFFPAEASPEVYYLYLVMVPLLIFEQIKVVYRYYVFSFVSLIAVWIFQQYSGPIIKNISMVDIEVFSLLNYINAFFLTGFMIIYFVRSMNEDYQEKLLDINSLLSLQKSEMMFQNEDLNQANEELSSALDKLKVAHTQLVQSEKMASLGQLTAGVAHEINNPINFISANIKPLKRDLEEIIEIFLGYSAAMHAGQDAAMLESAFEKEKELEGSVLIDEIQELLNGIEEGAMRTATIVQGLKSFTHMGEDNFVATDLTEGLESTLRILGHKIRNRINVVRDYRYLPPVECVPGKINQVFMNLLSNAVDVMENQGELTILIRYNKGAPLPVTIRVSDTGPGMTEEVQKRIFEPFFTTKQVGKGTGMGLSISYNIIEQHNGKLEVHSTPGEGASFTIRLPQYQHETESDSDLLAEFGGGLLA